MKYRAICCLLLAALWATPAQAQWYRKLGSALRRVPAVVVSHQPTPSISAPLERAVYQAAVQQPRAHAQLAKSIVVVKEKELLLRFAFPTGTGFVLEETYQGKKYLWGVTVTHYAFQKPAVKLPKQRKSVRVPFVIQGSAGMGDVSLFPLPPQLAGQVTALTLANKTPQVGEELFSIGFFNKSVHIEEHRILQEITPSRMITSLQVAPKPSREGACGGPVLNQQGEVVGIHIGSSYHAQTGFAVPLSHIRQALAAYHQQDAAPQPLLYNGVFLGPIAVNEAILTVRFYAQNKLLYTFKTFRHEKEIDYAHLEALSARLSLDPQRIEMDIERNPLSSQETDKRYRMYTLSYDIKTGELTRSFLENYYFPR